MTFGLYCTYRFEAYLNQAMTEYTVHHNYMVFNILYNTGLFISPSGISDPCGTVAGMVMSKGSMSTEGKTLQVSVLHLQFPARAIC